MSMSVRFELPSTSVPSHVKFDRLFTNTIKEVFGSLPRCLSDDDVRELSVIAAIQKDEPGWQRLIYLIQEHQNITVIEEY